MTEVLQVVIGGPAAAIPLSDPYLADVLDLLQTVDSVMWQIRAAEIIRRGMDLPRGYPRRLTQVYVPPPPDEPPGRIPREVRNRMQREIEDKPPGLARITRISKTSWWKGREEALKAKQSFEKLRDAGVEMRQLED
ncbi:hypothetical protein ACBR40_35125 [Nonomuraea sp. AD125B]|uniref:hypothetical protein n=1 Tax=Nonomuraea sp. AD125B TaxID=3242897 RepID=UPI003529CBB2